MKRLFLLFFSALLCIAVSAHDFEVDGIYYEVTSSSDLTVAVTYQGGSSNLYSGSVVIPEKVTYNSKEYSITSIGNRAFYYCSGLTSVTIPNSVTSIGYEAFYGCSGLTSVTIPNSVTSIGNHAFRGCSGLTSVTIGNSVTSIGEYAFQGCSGLTSVTIPNSVTSIGKYAFWGCSGLTSVTIPNSVTSIGECAFYLCSALTTIEVESGNTKYDSRDNCNAIIETNTNTLIVGCKNTVIPNSVTSIGKYAFRGCKGLTSVTIPNSVTSIGNSAFSECSGLKNVTIPNSVTSIGDWAFYLCSALTSVTIGNSVTSIGEVAFWGSSLTAVHITDLSAWCKIKFGNNPTSYAHHLYLNGEEITNLVIPNDVTSIGDRAFSGCSGITSVTIPNSVTSIGDAAFIGCSGLTSVTIPNSVTSIGNSAFDGCSGLTSVRIEDGESTLSLDNYVFSSCPLTTLYLGRNISYTVSNSSPFSDKTKLSAVNIGNNVTNIGEYLFSGCSALTSITIPESCKTVPQYAFEWCINLQELTLPSTCIACYDYSFYGCSSLKKINCQAETPPAVYANTFSSSIYTKATLKVPEAYVDKYKAANIWKDFKTIRHIGYVEVESITFDKATYELEEGDTMELAVTVSPEDATDKTLSWKSSNETIATVNDGVVTAIKPGNATITATSICTSAVTATCKIVVTKKYVSVTGIALDKTIAEMAEGETLKLTATISPDDATDKTITWTSSNESVATVKNGTVTAVKEGKAIITAKAGEMTATCEITVIHTDQCAAPVITYADGKLQCTCETEGAKFKYMLTDTDIKTEYTDMYNGSVNLSACYTIKAYAYADGYTNSEQVTATLYWVDGSDVSTNINQTEMRGVMATCSGGIITVSGLSDGETVMFYDANGALLYTGTAQNGIISYAPSASGVIIVKIGTASIKVVK